MKEVRYWEANDGTTFGTEEECEEYEEKQRLESLGDDLVCLDIVGKRIDPHLNPEEVYFVKFADERACVTFRDFFDDLGYSIVGLDCAGFYYYDEIHYCWRDIKRLAFMYDRYSGFFKKYGVWEEEEE